MATDFKLVPGRKFNCPNAILNGYRFTMGTGLELLGTKLLQVCAVKDPQLPDKQDPPDYIILAKLVK